MLKVNDFKCAVWLAFPPPILFFLTIFLPGVSENSTFWLLFSLIVIEITGLSLWLKITLFYLYRHVIKKNRTQSLTDGESATDSSQRKMPKCFKNTFGIIATAIGGIALITCLLLGWHIAERQAQYCVWGPSPEITVKPTRYMIDECKSLKLNIGAIAKDKLDGARIEVRMAKVCFTLPCRPGQTAYDLGDNLIPCDKMTVFRGFNRGMTYGIMIVTSGDDTLWSAQIHVADDWYKELYYTDIYSIPAGTLMIGILLVILCLSGICRFGFGSQKQS